MIVLERYGTFLFRAGPGDLHLHICLTDPFDAPNEIPQQVLVVSVTTVYGRLGEDSTCLLYPGDHEFIKDKSYIAYSRWRYLTPRQIQTAEAQGLAREKTPLNPAVFQRVRAGIFQSARVAPCARDFLQRFEATLTP